MAGACEYSYAYVDGSYLKGRAYSVAMTFPSSAYSPSASSVGVSNFNLGMCEEREGRGAGRRRRQGWRGGRHLLRGSALGDVVPGFWIQVGAQCLFAWEVREVCIEIVSSSFPSVTPQRS